MKDNGQLLLANTHNSESLRAKPCDFNAEALLFYFANLSLRFVQGRLQGKGIFDG